MKKKPCKKHAQLRDYYIAELRNNRITDIGGKSLNDCSQQELIGQLAFIRAARQ